MCDFIEKTNDCTFFNIRLEQFRSNLIHYLFFFLLRKARMLHENSILYFLILTKGYLTNVVIRSLDIGYIDTTIDFVLSKLKHN